MKRNIECVGKWLLLLAPVLVASVPASAGDAGFSAIVNRLAEHYHQRPAHLMGLAAFVANRAHPEGVHNLKLAVFEDLDPNLQPPGEDFGAFVERVVGPEWRPFVRVRSRRDGETTYIYTRDAGKRVEFLIVTLEQTEATVTRFQLDPAAMAKWVDDPVDLARREPRKPTEDSAE